MFHKNTLRYPFYVTVVIVILTLTGIFSTFESREVLEDYLTLATVTLGLMIGVSAYVTALPMRGRLIAVSVNSLIGVLIPTLALILIVVLDTRTDLTFVFQRLKDLNPGTLTSGKIVYLDGGGLLSPLRDLNFADWITVPGVQLQGFALLLLFAVVVAGFVIVYIHFSRQWRTIIFISLLLTVVLSLASGQLDRILTLPDAVMLFTVFALGYFVAFYLPESLWLRTISGFSLGMISAGALVLLVNNGALDAGGVLRGIGSVPRILQMSINGDFIVGDLSIPLSVFFILILGVIGAFGALINRAPRSVHDASLYFALGLLLLGILQWGDRFRVNDTILGVEIIWNRPEVGILRAIIIFFLLCMAMWIVPRLSIRAEKTFLRVVPVQRHQTQFIFFAISMLVLLIAPQFMGLYISNVFNLIALYTIMGIGLNVMVGYAGLLDLGYVASFAIGAYTLGILTKPNILTCGGADPATLENALQTCTGVMTFWQAWPICVVFSAVTGMLLGVPVLRLRGDYLAIVTLGFGEITNRIIKADDFKPLFGAASGITRIPSPVIDLTRFDEGWYAQLNNSTSIYYLFLFSVLFAAFVVYRLANSRIGRAWRAVKADENVAQAMGIHLVNTKLLAFGVSSAFAGLGGAVFGASVQGIFPDSFTILVSINVLSLIIIGGMGSIPGVVLGSMILIGLPELLRELDDYRLLSFGVLLVVVMLIKPEGILPPSPPKLAEKEQVIHG
ncbi:MAG: hypothetical protein D6711_04135 [Chloroflexi bacterium]|nr:MAG: hypothetical protein D6711_04135 [Chloroflexota bacterium]